MESAPSAEAQDRRSRLERLKALRNQQANEEAVPTANQPRQVKFENPFQEPAVGASCTLQAPQSSFYTDPASAYRSAKRPRPPTMAPSGAAPWAESTPHHPFTIPHPPSRPPPPENLPAPMGTGSEAGRIYGASVGRHAFASAPGAGAGRSGRDGGRGRWGGGRNGGRQGQLGRDGGGGRGGGRSGGRNGNSKGGSYAFSGMWADPWAEFKGKYVKAGL